MPGLAKAFAKLNSLDYETREEGFAAVRRVLRRHWRTILQWAPLPYPADEGSFKPTGEELLGMFLGFHPPGLVEEIESIYDSLAGKCRARETALRVLMDMGTEEALGAVVRLLDRPSSRDVGLTTALWAPLRKTPPVGLCLFPGLLEVLPNLIDCGPVYRVVLAYVGAGALDLNRFPAFRDYCTSRVSALLESEFDREAPPGADAGTDPRLAAACAELGWLLHVLGFFRTDEKVVGLLRRALDQPGLFPRLPAAEGLKARLFAATSLLALGQPVETSILESIAGPPPLRWRLWSQLEDAGRLDAFPPRYRNQTALAEAEMVQWLEYPTEMGCAPEQIESLTTADYPGEPGERLTAYFFRFRHPKFLGGKWFVGMAGPYPAEGPARLGGPQTFSIFKEESGRFLQDHVKDYLPER